jgi:hypothetical protein
MAEAIDKSAAQLRNAQTMLQLCCSCAATLLQKIAAQLCEFLPTAIASAIKREHVANIKYFPNRRSSW